MSYVRKTRDRYDIETNHGYGWETEYSSYEYTDARQTLADYRTNALGRFSTRLIKRREYLKPKEPPAITNADRIRNMDDYDLAILLENVSCKHADTESWLDWLKQEVKADA